jgi:hypothetical protein
MFSPKARRYSEDDEDLAINSELIWQFNDVDKELLRAYPNGRALTERVISIGGLYTWRVDFYPNGRDHRTYGNIVVAVSLENTRAYDRKPVEAECNFNLFNKMKRQNYVGKLDRCRFEVGQTHEDSSFESCILKECYPFYPLQITISITQFPYSSSGSTSSAATTTPYVSNTSHHNTIGGVSYSVSDARSSSNISSSSSSSTSSSTALSNSLQYASQLNKSSSNLTTTQMPIVTNSTREPSAYKWDPQATVTGPLYSSRGFETGYYDDEDYKKVTVQNMYNKYRNL